MKWISVIALLLCSGCIVDDFNDMGEGFIPTSPRDAALMAVDQYNPDHRRQGITLFANSNFGGAPESLAIFRHYYSQWSNNRSLRITESRFGAARRIIEKGRRYDPARFGDAGNVGLIRGSGAYRIICNRPVASYHSSQQNCNVCPTSDVVILP